jgi:hypothetical protein
MTEMMVGCCDWFLHFLTLLRYSPAEFTGLGQCPWEEDLGYVTETVKLLNADNPVSI